MPSLHVEPDLPHIPPAQGLAGWRRELCIELLGQGAARIFVRAVEHSSFKAAELQRAILFVRLSPHFTDLEGWVEHMRPDLGVLADTARLTHPDKDNLFTAVEFDRVIWERVQQGADRWSRRG